MKQGNAFPVLLFRLFHTIGRHKTSIFQHQMYQTVAAIITAVFQTRLGDLRQVTGRKLVLLPAIFKIKSSTDAAEQSLLVKRGVF